MEIKESVKPVHVRYKSKKLDIQYIIPIAVLAVD